MADINNVAQVGIALKSTYDDGLIQYRWSTGRVDVKGNNITITQKAVHPKDPPVVSHATWGQITDQYSTTNGEELVDYWHSHFFFGEAPTDYINELILGNITGRSILKGLGERETISTTAAGEDLWRGNELTPAPASHTTIPTPADAGDLMSVVSENAEDGAGTATGVLTLRIHYLDPAGAEQTVDVTMNGTTIVDIPVILMRFVQDWYSLTTGSLGVAAGHIKIHKTGTVNLVYSMIAAGGNKSLVPHRMVPAGKTLILKSFTPTEGGASNRRTAVRIRSTDMYGVLIPGVFCFKGVAYLNMSSASNIVINDPIPSFSIVKVSAWSTLAGAESGVSWWGELRDN